MIKLILFCFLAICFLSCTPNKKQNASSKIILKKDSLLVIINQTKNDREEFRYFDYFGNSELASFPKNDTLCINTPYSIIAYNTIGGDFSDITYYPLFPKDTIYLTLKDGKEILSSRNKILENKITLMSSIFFNAISRNYPRNSNFITGLKSINDNYLNKKNIIESNKNKVDSATLKEASDMINYDKLASVLSIYTQYNKKNDSILTILQKADTTAWNYLTFRNVLTNYTIYIDKVYHIHTAGAYTNYIRKNFPVSIQDYAIFNYLCSYKPDNKIRLDTLSTLITEFSKSAHQKDLAENLAENLRKYKENFETKDSRNVALLSTKNGDKPTSLDKVLNQNKGKIIYVDFWATWCAPCLAEMPYSSVLANKYKSKGAAIIFLYLSKDENMASWQTKSKQLEMPETESFIVLKNDAFTKFCNKYGLKTIPRYMIIGKKGEMINADALRPSDPKLKIKLDGLLN